MGLLAASVCQNLTIMCATLSNVWVQSNISAYCPNIGEVRREIFGKYSEDAWGMSWEPMLPSPLAEDNNYMLIKVV